MKKNNFKIEKLIVIVSILLFSCTDDSLDRLDQKDITTGAILRTLSTDLPVVDRDSPTETTLNVNVEFDDFLGQDTLESVDVYASFVDTSPVDDTNDGIENPAVKEYEEVFVSNVSSSEFSKAENGKNVGNISVRIGDVMEKIGITKDDLYGGDVFLMRLALKVTNGNVIYTSTHVRSKIQGSSAFLSTFRYSTSVVCAPPAGTWTIEMEDSYGDGWNGAKIVVNLNGEETDYTITDGSSGSGTIEVPEGSSALVFTFVSGAWDSEITFSITSPDGIITNDGPTPTAGPIKLNVDFCQQ